MRSLSQPPAPQPLRVVTPYRPMGYRPHMAQFVEVNPDVNVPVTIEFGSLPLTIGFFAASGVSFLVGSQVPEVRGVTTVVGVGLAGAGIINLLISSAKGASAAEETPSAPVSPGSVSPPLQETEAEALALVEGRIITPSEGAEIDVSPIGTPRVPLRARLTNPSTRPVSFDLSFSVEEQPEPFGDTRMHVESMRVSLGSGETRDFDLEIPIASWEGLVDYVEVDVTMRKAPFSGGPPTRLYHRYFVIE